MTTVGAIIFLITPSAKVATVELFNEIRDGDYRMASVIATLLILVILSVNILFSIFILRKKKEGNMYLQLKICIKSIRIIL